MSRRLFLLALALVTVISVLGGLLAGSSPDALGINWEVAGVVGTAIGTISLAVATGALAFSTWRDVTATQELVTLTARDMEGREKPILKAKVLGFVGPNDAPNLKVEFRNIGKGPAVDVLVRAGWTDAGGVDYVAAPFEVEPINQGGMVSVEIPMPAPPFTFAEVTPFVEGTYTDRSSSRVLKLSRST